MGVSGCKVGKWESLFGDETILRDADSDGITSRQYSYSYSLFFISNIHQFYFHNLFRCDEVDKKQALTKDLNTGKGAAI